jgi:hypothetical protein
MSMPVLWVSHSPISSLERGGVLEMDALRLEIVCEPLREKRGRPHAQEVVSMDKGPGRGLPSGSRLLSVYHIKPACFHTLASLVVRIH